jgi:hypothetical protein
VNGGGGSENNGGASAGNGGNGGTITVTAGTFDMSNSVSGSFNNTAGVVVNAQNSGMSSLIQQSMSVQTNVTLNQR